MAAIPVEYASERKIRERNKLYYRFNHWPIWIFVFFIAPGPLTFDLFERGFDARMALWLGAVLVGTGIAGLRGRLPGVEPKPYIIRFTEDRPNPLYRRVCYTFAWSEAITFAVLNIAGLVVAIVTGHWYLKQMYRVAYFPIAGTLWVLGALGQLFALQLMTRFVQWALEERFEQDDRDEVEQQRAEDDRYAAPALHQRGGKQRFSRGRACAGHPRLATAMAIAGQDVGPRNKAGRGVAVSVLHVSAPRARRRGYRDS